MSMKHLNTVAALASGLILATGTSATAQTAVPAQTAPPADTAASPSPIRIDKTFVIPWHHDSRLACLGFTNVSDKMVQAVRFGISSVQEDPLDDEPIQDDYVDRVGSFAPGVENRAPRRILGTVDSTGPALKNCWETQASVLKTELHITVLKVVYADGTVWLNPTPTLPLVSLTY